MKIQIELFGASRDFSDQNLLELDIKNDSTIKDVRNKILNYLIYISMAAPQAMVKGIQNTAKEFMNYILTQCHTHR